MIAVHAAAVVVVLLHGFGAFIQAAIARLSHDYPFDHPRYRTCSLLFSPVATGAIFTPPPHAPFPGDLARLPFQPSCLVRLTSRRRRRPTASLAP